MRLTLIGLALAIGCATQPAGRDSPPPQDSPSGISPTQFCQGWLALRCAARACCSNPEIRDAGCASDPRLGLSLCCSSDPANNTALCGAWFGTLENPNVRWDGVAAAAALERFRAQTGACSVSTAAELPDAFIAGSGVLGSDCTTHLGPDTRFAACAVGYCDPNAGRCIERGGVGAPCAISPGSPQGDDQRCLSDLYCPLIDANVAPGVDAGASPVCVARAPNGSACDSLNQAVCRSRYCAADSGVPPMDGGVDSGAPVQGNCAPPIADGNPCGPWDFCAGRCVNGRCVTLAPADDEYCAPPPPRPGYFG